MPPLLRGRGVVHLLAGCALAFLVACGSVKPTPTVAPTAVPTRVAVLLTPTATPLPTETDTPESTETATSTATITPTVAALATLQPAAATTRVPVAPAGGGGIGDSPWFMAPLIAYFSRLGPYPPEPAPSRPANINPLTGLAVADPALLQRRPLVVRLGNDPTARPQTGLNEADLVFEEPIDQRNGAFALTRFTAVFLGQDATFRPLRSERLVNASLVPMFNGALVHSGGSKDTRFMMSQLPWYALNLDGDLNGRVVCSLGTYWVTRFASTVEHVHDYLRSKGLEQAVALRGFDFSPTPPAGTAVTSLAFDHLPWPVHTAGVTQWKYDAGSGRYLRFVNGAPHDTLQYSLAANWGGSCTAGTAVETQVSAANVVVLNAEFEPTPFIEDTNNFTSVFVQLVGSGTARIYRDGVQIVGSWQRPTLQHFIQFFDGSGNPVQLKPGNTWFELVPLNYTPTTH